MTPGESMPTSKEVDYDNEVFKAGMLLDDAYSAYAATFDIAPWRKAKDAYVAAIEARLRASLSASPEPSPLMVIRNGVTIYNEAQEPPASLPNVEAGLDFEKAVEAAMAADIKDSEWEVRHLDADEARTVIRAALPYLVAPLEAKVRELTAAHQTLQGEKDTVYAQLGVLQGALAHIDTFRHVPSKCAACQLLKDSALLNYPEAK